MSALVATFALTVPLMAQNGIGLGGFTVLTPDQFAESINRSQRGRLPAPPSNPSAGGSVKADAEISKAAPLSQTQAHGDQLEKMLLEIRRHQRSGQIPYVLQIDFSAIPPRAAGSAAMVVNLRLDLQSDPAAKSPAIRRGRPAFIGEAISGEQSRRHSFAVEFAKVIGSTLGIKYGREDNSTSRGPLALFAEQSDYRGPYLTFAFPPPVGPRTAFVPIFLSFNEEEADGALDFGLKVTAELRWMHFRAGTVDAQRTRWDALLQQRKSLPRSSRRAFEIKLPSARAIAERESPRIEHIDWVLNGQTVYVRVSGENLDSVNSVLIGGKSVDLSNGLKIQSSSTMEFALDSGALEGQPGVIRGWYGPASALEEPDSPEAEGIEIQNLFWKRSAIEIYLRSKTSGDLELA